MKKIFVYFWSLRREFSKYFAIGFSGVVLDMVSLILFKEIFGWWPTFAVMVNQVVLLGFIFSANKYWTFRDKTMPHKQVVRFLLLAGFNYLFSVLTMYVFNHRLGFDYRWVRILTIALMVTWNFLLYKYWVYQA